MRAVWVDAGNDPDPVKLQDHSITAPFFDGRWLADKHDPLAYLNSIKKTFPNPGVFLCAQGEGWPTPSTMSGKQWADWAYEMVQHKIAPGTSGSYPLVDFNCEVDDPSWVVNMFKRWRTHSPRRTTAWVVECHKAPLYAGIAKVLVDLGIIIKPECFVGNMARVESASEVLSWANIGIPVGRIQPCLDGAALGAWWTGTVFTMGRLP